MMRCVAFFARGSVFVLITIVGALVIPTENLIIDRTLRLSVSALQVFVVLSVYAMYVFINTILAIIQNTSPPRFSRLDRQEIMDKNWKVRSDHQLLYVDNKLQSIDYTPDTDATNHQSQAIARHSMQNMEEPPAGHGNDHFLQHVSRAASTYSNINSSVSRISSVAKSPSQTQQNNPSHSQAQAHSQAHAVSQAQPAHSQAHAVSQAQPSSPLQSPMNSPRQFRHAASVDTRLDTLSDLESSFVDSKDHSAFNVTFESQQKVDWYVLKIHVIGLALWQTFLSFDCTLRDIDISFITGLVMAWFVCGIRHTDKSYLRTGVVLAYTVTMLIIILTESHVFVTALPPAAYHTSAGRIQLYFNLRILPFFTGAFWIFVSSHVPVSAAMQDPTNIVRDTQRSCVTFILISLTFPLYWTQIDLVMVQNFLAQLPHISILCVLILSPFFKFISIYIMLVSLRKQQVLDFVVILVLVLCLNSAVVNEFDRLLLIRVVLSVALLAVHLIFMTCHRCQSLQLT